MRKSAYYLYLLFIVFWFLHVGDRLPILGVLRPDLLLILVITGMIALSEVEDATGAPLEHASLTKGSTRTRRLIITLLIYSMVVIPFVEWPGSVLHTGLPNIIKAVVFYFFTSRLITSEQRLRGLLIVFLGAMTFRVLEPMYLHVTTGYWGSYASMGDWESMDRLSGAPSDVVNPNGLAFVILTVVPFLHYLAPLTILGGLAYLATLPILVWALLLTGSRSGLVGLGAIVMAIWLKSRRKLPFALALVIGVAVIVPTLSDDLRDRYLSIFDSNTKNARTAQGRMSGVRDDLNVALRRPFFGHGLGTSAEANSHFGTDWRPSHNLYTEAAQEIGFIGLTILTAMIVSIAWNLHVSLRELKLAGVPSPLISRLASALQVWLAMDILFSFASYGLSSYEWYFAAGLSEVVRRFAAEIRVGNRDAQLMTPALGTRKPLSTLAQPVVASDRRRGIAVSARIPQ